MVILPKLSQNIQEEGMPPNLFYRVIITKEDRDSTRKEKHRPLIFMKYTHEYHQHNISKSNTSVY